MTNRVEALLEQAKALSAEEQMVLLSTLQDLVAPAPAGWEAAWIGECEDRLSAFDRGETKAADFDDAISDLRRKYGRA
jgi:hypothetical protein